MLNKSRKFEQDNYCSDKRPKFHVSSPVGWINDPNGFSCFNKEYHLFYQYHPYGNFWGPMHWGHSKTLDFIKWENVGVALAPEETYENFGCFSGTAIENDGQHILMYTGVYKDEKIERQTQCIAIGDGFNYEKLKENPVITATELPKGSSEVDFRDPKIWKDGDYFYSIVASRNEDGSGQLPLYRSKDLINWEYMHIVDRSNNELGDMWECPDFFKIDDTGVILVSPQDMKPVELEFHGGHNTLYILGEIDKDYKFERKSVRAIDYGLDFYAPQTLCAKDGRRIMIAWMQSWDNHILHEDCNWSGLMTIPRELTIKNNILYQNPVREIENYYEDTVKIDSKLSGKNISLDGINGRYVDITLKAKVDEFTQFDMVLASNGKHYSKVSYANELLSIDRTYCGLNRDYIGKRDAVLTPDDGFVTIRVLVDRYSIEVFANDGKIAMTMKICTEENAKDILFNFNKETEVSIIKHSIK